MKTGICYLCTKTNRMNTATPNNQKQASWNWPESPTSFSGPYADCLAPVNLTLMCLETTAPLCRRDVDPKFISRTQYEKFAHITRNTSKPGQPQVDDSFPSNTADWMQLNNKWNKDCSSAHRCLVEFLSNRDHKKVLRMLFLALISTQGRTGRSDWVGVWK